MGNRYNNMCNSQIVIIYIYLYIHWIYIDTKKPGEEVVLPLHPLNDAHDCSHC